MTVLVGSTGFVGSNLLLSGGKEVDLAVHSSNVQETYGMAPDLLLYAGLPAAKYLANHAPERDMAVIQQAEENIRGIGPKKLVLISTIDVYPVPKGVDENSPIDDSLLHPYGYNRRQLELWAREFAPDALIVRLPGLFGKNLRKNFIYDLLHPAPSMLTEDKLAELSRQDGEIARCYGPAENGFCKLLPLENSHLAELEGRLSQAGFTSLCFTDSRSVFQFYPLDRLWEDIQTALGQGLRLWNPATPPLSAGEIYRALTGNEFINHLAAPPADYDYRTRHGALFGGEDGYICSRETVLREIGTFVSQERQAPGKA